MYFLLLVLSSILGILLPLFTLFTLSPPDTLYTSQNYKLNVGDEDPFCV